MPTIRSTSHVGAAPEQVFAFFDEPANLATLMPPPVVMDVIRVHPSPPQVGTEIEFRYGMGPFRRSWTIRFVDHVPGERIVDETLSGPMRRFHHSHTFRAARGGGTWIEDQIDYHVGPDGPIGAVIDFVAGVVMRATFVWRHARQRRLLSG